MRARTPDIGSLQRKRPGTCLLLDFRASPRTFSRILEREALVHAIAARRDSRTYTAAQNRQPASTEKLRFFT